MEKYNSGDYVTCNLNNTIYEIINVGKYELYSVRIIYPKFLQNQLREQNVFTLKLSSNGMKLLGNPSKQPELKVLYG